MTCLDSIFALTVAGIALGCIGYGLGYVTGRWAPKRLDEGSDDE